MVTCTANISFSRIIVLVAVCLFYLDYCLAAAQNLNISNTEDSICENGHLKTNSSNAFSWADYTVLGAMLVISCGIGIFYGFFGPKYENSEDFLLGGSTMGTFPMAMSLAAK